MKLNISMELLSKKTVQKKAQIIVSKGDFMDIESVSYHMVFPQNVQMYCSGQGTLF